MKKSKVIYFLVFIFILVLNGCEPYVKTEYSKLRTEDSGEEQSGHLTTQEVQDIEAEKEKRLYEQSEDLKDRNTRYSLETKIDEFEKSKTTSISLQGLKEEKEPWLLSPSYKFTVYKIKPKGDSPIYYFTIFYHGEDWVFIQRGQSAVFLIDGKRKALSGTGSESDRDASGGGVFEMASYETNRNFLKALSKAKIVKLKIVGDKADGVFTLEAKHLKNIGQFLEDTK